MMKTLMISLTLFALVGNAVAQSGPRKRPRVFRDAATHETISEKAAKLENVNPMAAITQDLEDMEAVKKESKPFKPTSILARSHILNRAGAATLVPKRAVLYVPENLKGSFGMPKGGELVNWPEFYRVNRGWIRTLEVTRAQAEGWEPLPEEMTERFEESRQMIVAVYHASPISVMPYVDPVVGPETVNLEEE